MKLYIVMNDRFDPPGTVQLCFSKEAAVQYVRDCRYGPWDKSVRIFALDAEEIEQPVFREGDYDASRAVMGDLSQG